MHCQPLPTASVLRDLCVPSLYNIMWNSPCYPSPNISFPSWRALACKLLTQQKFFQYFDCPYCCSLVLFQFYFFFEIGDTVQNMDETHTTSWISGEIYTFIMGFSFFMHAWLSWLLVSKEVKVLWKSHSNTEVSFLSPSSLYWIEIWVGCQTGWRDSRI